MFMVAQIEEPGQRPAINGPGTNGPRGTRVAPPGFVGDGTDAGSTRILSPTVPNTPSANEETPSERKQRLMDAGVLPRPSKKPAPKNAFDRMANRMSGDTRRDDGTFEPIVLRADMSLGSWFSIVAPKRTRVLEDFSYGFSGLYAITRAPLALGAGAVQVFAGPAAVFYNGGVFVERPDIYGTRATTYADFNAAEVGAEVLMTQERLNHAHFSSAWEVRAQVLPLRMVKATYNAQSPTPSKSEAETHNALSAGLGVSVGASVSFLRAMGVGAFVGVSTALPAQLRARVGLTLFMNHLEKESPPAPPAAVAPGAPGVQGVPAAPVGPIAPGIPANAPAPAPQRGDAP